MRIPAVIRRVLIAIAFCCVACQSFGETQSEPGARTALSAPNRQGFLDYALGKVNPHDTDYGSKMVSARNVVVGYTISLRTTKEETQEEVAEEDGLGEAA